jgi:UDP-galactopyranose mutase
VIYADVLCLSHLRWNFVFQRPQHLMTRFAARHRVYFLEEPVVGTGFPFLSATPTNGVTVLTPQLPRGIEGAEAEMLIRQLLRAALRERGVVKPIQWFYTPMMLPIVDGMPAAAVAYDCMDELSAFAGAPPELIARERDLLARADVVFTGGLSLFAHKREHHPNVHAFPSSVDVAHFAAAREPQHDPEDQAGIPFPRIGYCGVIDERMDLALLDGIARLRPDWHFVMVGPVAKLDAATLPQRDNIYYLGLKTYAELPRYLSGWDVAMLPFAHNESTRYISPTKTPEYLAAGRPVVATSVQDIVRPYGELGLVRIADTADSFVSAIAAALIDGACPPAATDFLASLSWNRTWAEMSRLLEAAVARHAGRAAAEGGRVDAGSGTLGTAMAGEA